MDDRLQLKVGALAVVTCELHHRFKGAGSYRLIRRRRALPFSLLPCVFGGEWQRLQPFGAGRVFGERCIGI
jgi:hypothetical protein